jgi:hypothetical protein
LLPPSHNLKKEAAGSTRHLSYIPEERIYTFTTEITSDLTILLFLLGTVRYHSIQYPILTPAFIHFPRPLHTAGSILTESLNKPQYLSMQIKYIITNTVLEEMLKTCYKIIEIKKVRDWKHNNVRGQIMTKHEIIQGDYVASR